MNENNPIENTELTSLPNIGKEMNKQLRAVGINITFRARHHLTYDFFNNLPTSSSVKTIPLPNQGYLI